VDTTEAVADEQVAMVDPAYPRGSRAWWSVGVLTALYSLSLLDRQIIALLVPQIRSDLGISDFQIGLLQGMAFALFYVTFGLTFGWLVDRFSRRGMVFVGVSVWSLATMACGLARNFAQLATARFGVGAGEAALNPAAYSMISDSFPPHRRALAISVFGTGANLGGAASKVLGGFLIATLPAAGMTLPLLGHMETWRIVLLAAGAPGLLLALLIWTMVDPPRRERLQGQGSLRDTLAFAGRHWRFYGGHFLGFGLMAASAVGHQAWAPTFLIRQYGLGISDIVTILTSIALVAGVGGTLLSGYVADRLFARGMKDAHLWCFIVGGVVQAATLVAAYTVDSLAGFIVFSFLFNLFAGFAGVAPGCLQLVTPNNFRGPISSGYLFCFMLIGTGIGPTMVGLLTTYLYQEDAKLGLAVATNAMLMLPLSVFCLASALGPMRRAVAESAVWNAGPAPKPPAPELK
jgi:MFS family permease